MAPKTGKSSSSPGLLLFIVLTVREVEIKPSELLLQHLNQSLQLNYRHLMTKIKHVNCTITNYMADT